MNRENISRLILDAGNGDEEWAIIAKQLHKHFPDELEAFAALVASAEREACAKVCESIDMEAFGVLPVRTVMITNHCAEAIRARSKDEK